MRDGAHSRAVGLAALLASACQLAPTFQPGDAAIPTRAFGRIGDGGTAPSASFTPRLGPATNPWTDVMAGGPAPIALGPMRGVLPGGGGVPDLVVGGRAVLDDGTALVAIDLETGTELFRLADQRRLQRELMTTDGETICGIAVNTTSYNAIVTCLSFADGRELWRDDTGNFLSTGGETRRLADLELAGGVLYARVYDRVFAYDLATGARLFDTPTHTHWRGLVLAGDDLVTMGRPCASGACIGAVDPHTGALRAEHPVPGPVVYLFEHEGEAIFVNHSSYAFPIHVAYDPGTDTFRDAPEWAWASGLAGLTEIEGGTAFATRDGRGVVELDLESATIATSYPATEGVVRVHTNAVFAPSPLGGGSLESHPRGGGASRPAPALHFESWSFTAAGGWYDLP